MFSFPYFIVARDDEMRKVVTVLLSIFFMLMLFLSTNLVEQYKFNQLLYEGRSSVALNFQDFKRQENPNPFLEEVANEHGVVISKYAFKNMENMQVFTTDLTLKGRIQLDKGAYPQPDSTEFISTKQTNNPSQVGQFTSGESRVTLNVFLLSNQTQAGYDGIYYFDTQDDQLVDDIMEQLNEEHIGTELMNISVQPVFEWPVIVVVALMALLLSVLGALTFEMIHRNRDILLMKLTGYTYRATVLAQWRKLIIGWLIASGISYGLFFTYTFFYRYTGNMLELTLLFLVIIILFALLMGIYVACLVKWMYTSQREYEGLKGKKPYNVLMGGSGILMIVFLVFATFALAHLYETKELLSTYKNQLSLWEKTENLYTNRVSYVGHYEDDLSKEDVSNQAMKHAYNDLNEKVNGFVMDASNYVEVEDDVYLYEENTVGKDARTAPSGTSITINQNYLEYNPIDSEHGAIEEQLINDDNVLNLLVPVSLRDKETEIEDNYRDHFYFQKVEVENIYREAKGEPLNTLEKDKLGIHIIYVKDGQSYFTFNPEEDGEGDYFIYDPIVIIDNANFDASYYSSYLSRCYYFYSDEEDPMEIVSAIAADHDLTSMLQHVSSIYDEYGNKIHELSTMMLALIIVIGALSIASLSVSLYYTVCYFHKNKLRIFVQHVHGQGFYSLTKGLLVMYGCLFSVLLGLSFVVRLGIFTLVMVAMVALNLAVSIWLIKRLTKNIHLNLKKEVS